MLPFLISLILAIIFSIFLGGFIKKYNVKIYILSLVISVLVSYIAYNSKKFGIERGSFLSEILVYFTKGFIPTAIFIVVMFIGALNNKLKITRDLLKIRGELSIIASILMLSHIGLYLLRFINFTIPRILLGKHMPIKNYVITYSGIIATIIMIPLFITSFMFIRKKMKGVTWKKLQKYSYLFYFLTYIHIAACAFTKFGLDYIKLGFYSMIFLIYTIMRIKKYKEKNSYKKFQKA